MNNKAMVENKDGDMIQYAMMSPQSMNWEMYATRSKRGGGADGKLSVMRM